MHLDLVYNPVAGSFREERLDRLEQAFRGQGMAVRPMPTTAGGAQLSGTADLICVAGGDGTLRDTVLAMGEAAGKVPLSLARLGTINLVARELKAPRQPTRLAEAIARSFARGPDHWLKSPLYRLGELPIVSCLSIGPDANAVASVSSPLKARFGRYAYVVAMARQLKQWPRRELSIAGELADGAPFETIAEAAILSRGALYAGPFRLSPQAGLASNTVELITMRRSTRLATLGLGTAVVARLPIGRTGLVEIRSICRAHIDAGGAPVQVDGDHIADPAAEIGPSGIALRYCV